MNAVDEYLACAEAIDTLIASAQVASHWDRPSALEQWTVAGLAGHTARSVLIVPGIVAAEVDPALPTSTAVDYFLGALANDDLDADSAISRQVRERGLETAGEGPDDLVARYRAGVAEVAELLAVTGADRDVVAWGMRMPLSEYLVTRIVELAVHGDDLAVSVGAPPPTLPPSVEGTVLATLAVIAGRRRGFVEVMRGLARRERVTGPITAF